MTAAPNAPARPGDDGRKARALAVSICAAAAGAAWTPIALMGNAHIGPVGDMTTENALVLMLLTASAAIGSAAAGFLFGRWMGGPGTRGYVADIPLGLAVILLGSVITGLVVGTVLDPPLGGFAAMLLGPFAIFVLGATPTGAVGLAFGVGAMMVAVRRFGAPASA